MRTRTENDAKRDRQAVDRIVDLLAERVRFVQGDHENDRRHGRYDDAALGIRTQTRLEQLVAAVRDGLFDRLDADATTEAVVDVADAEHYAHRDEYVNGALPEAEPLADWERELLANSADPTPESEAALAAELALTKAHHTDEHDMATCPECRDQYEAEQLEDAAFQAALDAEAQDDAWSTAEQFEHDQACEARIDTADAARWAQGGAPF